MARNGWHLGTLALAVSLALTACGGSGDDSSSTAAKAPVAGGDLAAAPAAPSAPKPVPVVPVVNAPSQIAPNAAPAVRGTPAQTASTGEAWSFAPTATDADGDAVTWSITGKPADATFSPASGQLVWTPSASGAWSNIVITATDARGASSSLPPFSVQVNAAQAVASGTATLSWDIPQQYTDGIPLQADDQIVGYRVYHGTAAESLDTVVAVESATNVSYTLAGLTSGTHYFAVSAMSVTGAEGERSEVLSKTVM